MANNAVVLDGIRRLLALLEREMGFIQEIPGFVVMPDLLKRLEVIRHFGCDLSEISDWWRLPRERLSKSLKEMETVLRGLQATQMGYLRKAVPWILKERLETLRKEPWFSYRRAEVLADELEDYRQLVQASFADFADYLAELRSSYVELEKKFGEMENLPAEERVSAVLTPEPQRPRPDRKRDKRLRDQALRASMKGHNPSADKRGRNGRKVLAH